MPSDEFYDVGKNRGRKEIDSTNRTQVYSRIHAYQENAIVVDHENHKTEIWRDGVLRTKYETGTRVASDVVDDLRDADRNLESLDCDIAQNAAKQSRRARSKLVSYGSSR